MQRSKYRILGQIGQGQFARVYCAVERHTGELIALKDLDKDKFPTRLFLRELSNLTKLQHPNIVSCLGLEYTKTGRYLLMDYCEGGTLRELMESESKLSLFHSLKIITDILLGLEHAHKQDIIHCDLKPENILLKIDREGWIVRISDLGIARLSLETGSKDIGRGYTGSPAYMAPERFYGQYSPASDLYAVGVMLYEMVVGDRPFSGLPGEIIAAHINQQVEVPKKIPFLLRSVITTALQKLPQKRFASASEMLKSVRLAADVLVAEKRVTHPLSIVALEPSSNEPSILFYEPLSEPIAHLALASQQVYLATGDRVQIRTYVDRQLNKNSAQNWQVKFDSPVVDLETHLKGCFVVTQSSEKYSLYSLSKNTIDLMYCLSGGESQEETSDLVPVFSQNCKHLVSQIESQGRWLAIASNTLPQSATLKILNLPSLKSFQLSFDSPLPAQLVPLDSRHGLAIFSPLEDGSDGTAFRLFNRRGDLFDALSLPVNLRLVTPSATEPYRLFALEQSRPAMGIFIDLKPLKVTRIALEIVPEYILAREWGYILADGTGQFRLLARSGKIIGRFEVPLPPTAIAALEDFKLLIATWSNRMGMLYIVDFQKVVNFSLDEDVELEGSSIYS
jgi:serine/threonine-protein kinase